MTDIRRIFISSDPLMTKEKEQFSNRRWMKDLLTRPIERATGIRPESLASSRSDPDLIDRREFFARSGIEVDLDATQFWYDESAISDTSVAYLSQYVTPNDLVLGYELSSQTRSVFQRMGVPYIDMWLHPVRFMDDVLFGFNASDPSIRENLFSFDLPEDQMYLYADRLRVQTYKGWHRVEANIAPGSALFVGQMLNDKSVCSEGRMLSALDFKTRFEEIAANHARVYYSRHPYLKSGDEEIMAWVKGLPNVVLAKEPSYRMLASHRLERVFGLSSSLIQEAKYFGKDTEYLFRPVFTYGDIKDPESYATVLQDFVSPHFWSEVLSPVMSTRTCKEVRFIEPKDKIRDMLGFYWSYADIDKSENTRRRLNTKPKPAQKPAKKPLQLAAKPPRRVPEGFAQTQEEMSRLEARIRAHTVISFDIFDTLIERIVDRPEDLFAIMADRAREITGGRIDDFPAARRAARDLALDRANGEEVRLADRYAALAQDLGLTEDVGDALLELELEMERRVCRPRFAGRQAFAAAKAAGKRIILISDIFFDRDFVEELLSLCGYADWDRLYLSSEEGVLKRTGRLFDRVLDLEGIEARTLLHLGDNPKADIEMGASRGLSVAHLPDKSDIARRINTATQSQDGQPDRATRSLIKGLVARHETRGIRPAAPGFTGGDAAHLGYTLAGPILAGFASWIRDLSKEDGITDLYFLARDGQIVKRCYDILASADPSLPRAHYLLASRRALAVALLKDADGIECLLERNFTPCPLASLLKNRFGINADNLPVGVFRAHGFASPDDLADWRTGAATLRAFFTDPRVMGEILRNAEEERNLLRQAYTEAGLADPERKPAFVDIGHSGTLQAAISNLIGLSHSTGYYFATKADVDDVLADGHSARGYAVDRLRADDTKSAYQRHILMFELLFQNDTGSFVRFATREGGVAPVHLDLRGEEQRIHLIRGIHEGAVAFARDIFDAANALGVSLKIEGSEAIKSYLAMLQDPWIPDAQLFRGVGFENRFSARDMRWILPPPEEMGASALWPEGQAILQADLPSASKGPERPIPGLIRWTAQKLVTDARKRAKLERDPARFFAESRYSAIRPAARLF